MATLPNPLPTLAADPSGRALGLELPAGTLLDTTDEGPWHEPLLWCAQDRAVPGGWTALEPTRRVGLLPVVLDVGDGHGGPDGWELMPGEVSYPGDHDAEEVLAEYWEECAAEGDTWPGPAAPATQDPAPDADPDMAPDPDAVAAAVADSLLEAGGPLKDPRLALVPARRSADIPTAIGWTGPAHHEGDTARISAVLRSWEDRFGIRVVALGFDHLLLSVAAPPTTLAEAEAVAAEHFAFCPDNIRQSADPTLRSYAERQVRDQPTWPFWWD
ncbi:MULTISPECIES: DUF4253 domain-containing protein [Streptomyces]|uniref:DUF4253 domain-containing protein n=1 Tax=Streptomyces koelreuteriae TaxID=2838015 RepID=A0ABX8FRS3_9ACTN|nr:MULTISPECIES: DUF4253 domain-containing protein [Streptomyces]QWB23884.1 DUF4253 domain-containing protein [Streptomyces koelreuteriae]UUA06866.1 DUF4253 domain-containing protein [Streptomyces koelreuteriae]UUA14495.1 DUF4253 domain-containing protein [Streptomyces sp. CRCS-T-1]